MSELPSNRLHLDETVHEKDDESDYEFWSIFLNFQAVKASEL